MTTRTLWKPPPSCNVPKNKRNKRLTDPFKSINTALKRLEKDIKEIKKEVKVIKRKVNTPSKKEKGKKGRPKIDLTGQVFGSLTVIGPAETLTRPGTKSTRTQWKCRCLCGTVRDYLTVNLRSGNSTSCGCSHDVGKPIHGHCPDGGKSSTYSTWNCMKTRCLYPTHANYKNYGGKGIKVCKRWEKFANFLEDMGEKPEGCEIHRIDKNGDYRLDNCMWLSREDHIAHHRSE